MVPSYTDKQREYSIVQFTSENVKYFQTLVTYNHSSCLLALGAVLGISSSLSIRIFAARAGWI